MKIIRFHDDIEIVQLDRYYIKIFKIVEISTIKF